MATINTKYLGELRSQSVHLKSGKELMTDAPVDNNGKGETFSPTDLVCAALTSCMMTIMGIKAKKEGYSIVGLTAQTTKIMNDSPRKIKAIQIEFEWPNPTVAGEKLERLKNAALTCPVALSLSESLDQQVTFKF